jgi:peptidyl-Lys metalloendopeptidase
MQKKVVRGIVLFLTILVLAAPAVVAQQLESEIELIYPGTLKASEGVMVRFTLTNTTDGDLYILSYETPLRGFERDMFRVERDGEPIPYIGILALRIGPLKKDWIRIEPGASVATELNLSEAYDLQRGGDYSVKYISFQHVLTAEENRPVVDLSNPEVLNLSKAFTIGAGGTTILSNEMDVEIVGDLEPFSNQMFIDQGLEKNSYYGCQSTSTIASAESRGRGWLANGYYAASSYNSWYRDWFGTTSSYVSTVRNRMANAYYALGGNTSYTCNGSYCSSGVIAYTYQTVYNQMWLCPLFWNQDTNGKAHTIIHESFHWNAVAGTDDWTYGYSNCLWLADYYPYYALDNADNHAYAARYAD